MTESRPAGGTGSLDPKDYGVLYVDDERSNLAVLESSFSEAFRIWTANSVGDALEILDREPIAIAMVDQRMPEMEGTAFCELLRERFPDVKRILITAYASQRTAVEAINRGGVHHFMAKPWKWPELFQLLHGMIEKVHLERTVGRLQRAVLAQERTQTLSLMRAGILHDLAGMTAGMSVVCSALRHHVDDMATRMLPEDLRLLNDELETIETFLRQLSALHARARDHSVATSAPRRRVPVREIIDLVVALVRREAPHRVRFDHRCHTERSVCVDTVEIMRCLINLVRNAFQALEAHGEGGFVRIEARLESGRRAPDVVIRVRDDGPGISEPVRGRIFNLEVSTKKDAGGQGLGLFISQHLAEQNGGELELEDAEYGTCFALRLPVDAEAWLTA